MVLKKMYICSVSSTEPTMRDLISNYEVFALYISSSWELSENTILN
jgi:hypothetical protein